MNAIPKLALVVSDDGEVVGMPALVPPGEYRLRLDGWNTVMLFGRSPKLVLNFRIMDMGEHFEKPLKRWYNVAELVGRAGKSGKFRAGWSSDLVREYAMLVEQPARRDRLALSSLKEHLIIGLVETVATDRKQGKIAEHSRYSVVRRLLRIEL